MHVNDWPTYNMVNLYFRKKAMNVIYFRMASLYGSDELNHETSKKDDIHEVERRTDVDNPEVERGTDVDNLEVIRGIDVDNLEVVRGIDVPLSQEDKLVCYQPCTKHSKSKYHLDRFCKYHACLVCSKCARKVHAGCSVVPVEAVCNEITLMDIKDFGRDVLRKKADFLRTKENLDTKLLNHLEDQRVAVFQECQDMLGEYKAKFESLKMKFQTELEEVFKKHSKIISDQIAEIEKIVANLDEVYREVQMVENQYKHEEENHFIKIQDSVVKINRYLEDFRRLENSCETVSLKFHANEGLNKFITKVSSFGTLKVRIKNLDGVSCVDDVVFPPTLRGKGIDKTGISKYGTRRSLKFK